MSTSVKLDEDSKKKLDRLQALIMLKSGEKVPQQDILSMLIDEAMAKGGELGGRLGWAPLSDGDFDRFKALVSDWGAETSWREIDRDLYGPAKRRRGP